MNMAARMESTGAKHHIHISSETAELLKAAGKGSWIEKRKEMVDVKGKGSQHTYWVKLCNENAASNSSASAKDGDVGGGVEHLEKETHFFNGRQPDSMQRTLDDMKIARLVDWNVAVLTQRLQAIQQFHHQSGEIQSNIINQLKAHVEGIARMYRRNPFHNFEVCI